jgi:hypothetical protein
MLTLVAVVLAYDMALETCDLRSSMVEEVERGPRAAGRRSELASLKDKSWTRLEKDMIRAEMRRERTIMRGLGKNFSIVAERMELNVKPSNMYVGSVCMYITKIPLVGGVGVVGGR